MSKHEDPMVLTVQPNFIEATRSMAMFLRANYNDLSRQEAEVLAVRFEEAASTIRQHEEIARERDEEIRTLRIYANSVTAQAEEKNNEIERLRIVIRKCESEQDELYRNISNLESALRQVAQEKERETLERAAKVCERRAEDRFSEYGTREPDTGATYYGGRMAEELEARDEEDEDCAQAIRALSPTPTEDVSTPTELVGGYVRVPRDGTPIFDMRVTNITRQEAREIAEQLGGGAVLWQHDKCYPAMDVMCELRQTKGEVDERND